MLPLRRADLAGKSEGRLDDLIVEQGHPNLQRVRHRHLIGVPQKLVRKVVRQLEKRHLIDRL